MAYVPKYTSITIIRQFQKLLQEVSDEDVLKGLEFGEKFCEDFLKACGYELDDLPSEVEERAEALSTWRAIENLALRVPVDNPDRIEILEQAREMASNLEKKLQQRIKKTGTKGVRAVMKEIKEDAEQL